MNRLHNKTIEKNPKKKTIKKGINDEGIMKGKGKKEEVELEGICNLLENKDNEVFKKIKSMGEEGGSFLQELVDLCIENERYEGLFFLSEILEDRDFLSENTEATKIIMEGLQRAIKTQDITVTSGAIGAIVELLKESDEEECDGEVINSAIDILKEELGEGNPSHVKMLIVNVLGEIMEKNEEIRGILEEFVEDREIGRRVRSLLGIEEEPS